MQPGVLYKERTSFAWWVHVLIWGCLSIAVFAGLAGGGEGDVLQRSAAPVGIGLSIPLLFYGVFGFLNTEVSKTGIRLSWGPFGFIKKSISFESITKVEAVTYRPLAEFGGWGIRGMGKKKAWTVRGNRAVRMEMKGEKVFYLGSDRPERIAEWVRSADRKKEA